MLIKRIREDAEGVRCGELFVFRRGKGGVDQVLAMRLVCVRSIWRKLRMCYGRSWIK